MNVLAAIDLLDGRMVGLTGGGRFDLPPRRYLGSPVAWAKARLNEGMGGLHLVDLRGARSGQLPDLGTVAALARLSPPFLEVGGGVRTVADATKLIEAGADRVILGTAALSPRLLAAALRSVGAERLAVAVDLRAGRRLVEGWMRDLETLDVMSLAGALRSQGVRHVVYTDAGRDGSLSGVAKSLPITAFLEAGLGVAVAGGIAAPADLRRLSRIGVEMAVVGRALRAGRSVRAPIVAAALELRAKAAQ